MNRLIVVQGAEHPLLFHENLQCNQLNWVAGTSPNITEMQAKTRYRQKAQACLIQQIDAQQWAVQFEKPQWAITPGQSVVFYDGDVCLGGGIITQRS